MGWNGSKLDPNELELPKEPSIFQKNIELPKEPADWWTSRQRKRGKSVLGVMGLAGRGGPPPHYDYRPELKAPYTAIVRARDKGELSLAAAQLNGVLRRKVTYHGHDGACALYARFAPDASSHLADLGAVAISADYITPLRHNYAIAPIAYIAKVRKAAILVARRGIFGGKIREMVTRVTSGPESSISPWRGGDGAQRQAGRASVSGDKLVSAPTTTTNSPGPPAT